MSRGRHALFAALAVALGTTLTLAVLELAARAFVPASGAWQFDDATSDWRFDARLGWSNQPNLRRTSRPDSGDAITFETNEDGIQPATARRARAPGTLRILMLGDSTVVGRAVREPDRVHRQLQRALASRGAPVEVLNAGVEGYSTDQELLQLESLADAYAPDVVTLAVCNNDFGQNVLPSAYGMSKPLLSRGDGALHFQPPQERGHIEESASTLSRALRRSALLRAVQPALVRVRAAFGSWEARNTLGLANEIYYDAESRRGLHLDAFEAILARMASLAGSRGAKLYVYLHPALEEVWEPVISDAVTRAGIARERYDERYLERAVAQVAARNGIAFIAQVDRFRSSGQGPFHLLPRDPHCNATCYRLTAGLLAERIAADFPQSLAHR